MKTRITAALAAVIFALTAVLRTAVSFPAPVCAYAEEESERCIVRFSDTAPQSAIDGAVSELGLISRVDGRTYVLSCGAGKALASFGGVIDYAEPDAIRGTLALTDDPVRQEAFVSAGIYAAWDEVSASKDVIVAVLDTGISRGHEDLADVNVLPGYDAVARSIGVYEDSSGHGTAVTGVIAAAANNRIGIAGAAHGVTVLPVKVSSARSVIYSSDLISGIRYAADYGAKIINMSVGGYSSSLAEQEAVNYAVSRGCILIAAAGNDGSRSYAEQKCYPASYDGVISVASVSPDGSRSSFSHYNDGVDVAAPGENITVPVWSDGVSGYKTDSGTSYSAAIVSGIAALTVSDVGEVRFNADEFLATLVASCGSARTDEFGYGVISAPDMIAASRLPVVTRVVDGGVYSEKVTVGFNRGAAYLDGEPIVDGEEIVTNGGHELVVVDGENRVELSFTLNYSPLEADFRESGDHASFVFSRGSALLDGFPYKSGAPITASGRHLFTLTDGSDTYTRTVDLDYTLPTVYGVTDGATYDRPVGIKIAGGSAGYLDGARVGNEIAVNENGEHVLVVFGTNGKQSAEYRFTVDAGDGYRTYYGDLYSPHAAVDEEYGYILLYTDSLVGARVCSLDSPDKTERVLEVGSVRSHAFIGGYVLLFGEERIDVLDRAKVLSGEDCVINTFRPDGITACASDGESVFCFDSESVYTANIATGELTRVGDTGFECSYAVYSSGVIAILPYDGSEGIFLFDCKTYESTMFYPAVPVDRNAMCYADGLLAVGNRVFEVDGAETAREFGGYYAAEIKNGRIFSGSRVYDAATGDVVGIYPDTVSCVYLGEKVTVVFYEDGRIDVVTASEGGKPSLGTADYVSAELTAPEFADPYRADFFFNTSYELASAASYGTGVWFVFSDDASVYSFDAVTLEAGKTFTLRFFASSVGFSEDRFCAVFANEPYIYVAPADDPSSGEYLRVPAPCRNAFYLSDRLYVNCGGKLYVFDPERGIYNSLGVAADKAAAVNGRIAVLYNDSLILYDRSFNPVSYASVVGTSVCAGNGYISVGSRIYSSADLAFRRVSRGKVLALSDGISVTDSGIYDVASGGLTGRVMAPSPTHAVFTSDGALVLFSAGCVTVCSYFDGENAFNSAPAAEGVVSGGMYEDGVTVTYPFGRGFLDGEEHASGERAEGVGEHVFLLPAPCGMTRTMVFSIVPKTSGIAFRDERRIINVGESVTLRIDFLPEGSASVPVTFTVDGDGVTVDESGVASGAAVGEYVVTARVETGGEVFTAVCTVVVTDELILFPDGVHTVDRNSELVRGVVPGTTASGLISGLPPKGVYYVSAPDGRRVEGAVSTGDMLIMEIDGRVTDSLGIVVSGDTDGDGLITAHDLFVLGRMLRGHQYAEVFTAAGDVSGNGIITNGDLNILKGILLGRTAFPLGAAESTNVGSVSAQTFSVIESGGYIEVAINLNSLKYARAVSGTITYGEGLQYVSFTPLGWECDVADLGGALGFYAFSGDGSESGRAFRPVVSLRFRVVGAAGTAFEFNSPSGMTVEAENGCRNAAFIPAYEVVSEPAIGEPYIDLANGNMPEFDPEKHDYFAVIPYDHALADFVITRPEGCAVTVSDSVISAEDGGTAVIVFTYADGSSEYYTVRVRRESTPGFDPNCRLSRLEVEGFRLSPAFDPDVTDYTVTVPYGTEKISVYCVPQNKSAAVNVGDTALYGDVTRVTVTVFTPDGELMEYHITVERLPEREESRPAVDPGEPSRGDDPSRAGDDVRSVLIVAIPAALIIAASLAAYFMIKRRKK